MRKFFTQAKKHTFKTALVLAAILTQLSALGGVAQAIRNNRTNVPDAILDEMRVHGQKIDSEFYSNPGDGKVCREGRPYIHASWTWLSLPGNNNNNQFTITDSQDSLPIQFNSMNAACDALIDKNGDFANKVLIANKTLVRSNAARVALTGSVPASVNPKVDVSQLVSNPILQNWQTLYNSKNRFYKESDGQPPNREMTITGLAGLPPGNYGVKIAVTDRQVNWFRATNASKQFICVYDSDIFAKNIDDTTNVCPTKDNSFEFNLTVVPEYKGTCSITKINGRGVSVTSPAYLNAGENFTASFVVNNTGTKAWDLTEQNPVRLGSYGDTARWHSQSPAENRVNITGSAFGGAAQPTGASPEFTRSFRVDESLSGSQEFKWRLQKAADPTITQLGSPCSAPIVVKNNQPYLRISGGDVFSGYTFGVGQGQNGSSGFCSPASEDAAANDAAIITKGYSNADAGFVRGYSSSQYAVFASGAVGDPDRSAINNFVGNNGNLVDSNGNSTGANRTIKDLIFSNVAPGINPYGSFYGNGTSAVPCFDSSSIQKLVRATVSPSDLSSSANSFERYSGDLTLGSETIRAQKILWVDGTVKLNGNISYDVSSSGYQFNGAPKVPYLMIVATGGIEVTGGVSTLDGLYASLPATKEADGASVAVRPGVTSTESGRIDTCSDVTPGAWPDGTNASLTTNICSGKLTVNGALIARRVLWKRTGGTLGDAPSAANSACVAQAAGVNYSTISLRAFSAQLAGCAAEHINFSPEAYFGPFMSSSSSFVNSVPTTSTELPPIY